MRTPRHISGEPITIVCAVRPRAQTGVAVRDRGCILGATMKFGTFHLFQKPPGWSDSDVFSAEFGQIEAAEQLGFDGVWLA